MWIIPCIGRKKLLICATEISRKFLIKRRRRAVPRKPSGHQRNNNKFLKWCRNKKTAYRPDDVHIPASARLKGKSVLQPDDLIKLLSSDKTEYKGKRSWTSISTLTAWKFLQVFARGTAGPAGGGYRGGAGEYPAVYQCPRETTKGERERRALLRAVRFSAGRVGGPAPGAPQRKRFRIELPHQVTYRKHWQRYCSHNKIAPVTLYELRHTFVSWQKCCRWGK